MSKPRAPVSPDCHALVLKPPSLAELACQLPKPRLLPRQAGLSCCRHPERPLIEAALIVLVAYQLASLFVDEVKLGTGPTDHGFVGATRIVRIDSFGQPVLHVHAGFRTFEKDVSAHAQ